MEFRLLGSLEVLDGSRPVPVGGARQRPLLALLLLHANELVASDWLLEELWQGQGGPRALNALQAAVSRLRRVALQGRLETRPLGYLLRVEAGELDVERFQRGLSEGRAALAEGDPAHAAELLREALALFRDEPLADFRYEPFAQGEIARLEELRLEALECRIEADLMLGGHEELVGELPPLVAAYPLRERLCGQLMLALYRCGRHAEALAAYRRAREQLVGELGIEPGPELRELERRILRQDPGLAPLEVGVVRQAGRVRKTVTVVVLEVAAALVDPEGIEALRERALAAAAPLLARYRAQIQAGAGGRLVAVFGTPAVREDDALRACRAALELRELPELAGVRMGIASGEVLAAGTEVAGAVLERARELVRAAGPGEILLAEETPALAPAALEWERAEEGLRLLAVTAARPLALRLDTPFVGREGELRRLRALFAEAARERMCLMAAVIGEAGIGKTRLARELVAAIGTGASVLTGRCRAYGEGITFWPLRELVGQAGARAGTRAEIARLLPDTEEGGLVAERVAAALGSSESGVALEEVYWAARRLLEELAREWPLVVVLEDLHWAEASFLDLVEHVASRARAPILLLCLARPELLEARPSWAERAERIVLTPLSEEAAGLLLGELSDPVSHSTNRALLEAAQGNPLFLEQLAAALGDRRAGEGLPPPPPTLQALLASRLERLGPGERTVLERSAVLGKDFSLPALGELLPEEARPPLARHLDALVGKGFAERVSPDAYRFRHVLIQQAAYCSIPKALRAELHERYADWLEQGAGRRDREDDEILAYHLEQAHRWLAELGPATERRLELATRAGERLAASGLRAFARGDMPAATSLLERATALLPPDDGRRLSILPSLGRALTEQGHLERAEAVLSEAIESGRAAGERAVAADATVARAYVRLHTDARSTHTQARRELEHAIGVFEQLQDEGGLARALGLAGVLRQWDGQSALGIEELERALRHARAAADRAQEVGTLRFLLVGLLYGPMPVPSARARVEEIAREAPGQPRLEVAILRVRAHLEAMQGRFDAARALIADAQAAAHELGLELELAAGVRRSAGEIELLAGDPAAAERALRPALETLERLGIWTHLPSVTPAFADALHAQGRGPEAMPAIELAAHWTVSEDVEAQIGIRRVRARLLAQRGELAAAKRLAREAAELAARTDLLDWHVKALADRAEVLRLADQPKQARDALEQAIHLSEQKGNLAAARTLSQLLAWPALSA